MAKITIGFFLEDVAQERFMTAIVKRVATQTGISDQSLTHDIRNATGGGSIREFRQFLRDCVRGRQSTFDVIVVAIDGNCTGYAEKRQQLLRLKEQTGYAGVVVCAVPDPHVERWYLADGSAWQTIFQLNEQPRCPPYKCERGRYKTAIIDAIRSAGVTPLLGDAEFAPRIVEVMDFYRAGQVDASFQHFIKDLRDAFASMSGTPLP